MKNKSILILGVLALGLSVSFPVKGHADDKTGSCNSVTDEKQKPGDDQNINGKQDENKKSDKIENDKKKEQ